MSPACTRLLHGDTLFLWIYVWVRCRGLDSSDEHVAILFERYDADGTGAIERLEYALTAHTTISHPHPT